MEPTTDTQLQFIVGRKKVKMTRQQLIRFQLLVHCYLLGYMEPPVENGKRVEGTTYITNKDLDCMTLLGLQGTIDLSLLCNQSVGYGLFKSTQSARNAIDKMEDRHLVIKEGINGGARKVVYLNPSIGTHPEGNVRLEYTIFSLDETTYAT